MKPKIVISFCLVICLVLPAILARVIETSNMQMKQMNAEQEDIIETAKRNALTDWEMFKLRLTEAFAKLNEPRNEIKNGICVWKICSHPLKFRKQPKERVVDHGMASKSPGLNRNSKIICLKDIKTGHKTCDIQI